jgi:predicted dehydrogenase
MAWNITQCKKMIEVAKETGSILSIGHQRHYSLLYAHAAEVISSGVLGDVHHIRALWHRNNSWPYKAPTGGLALEPGTNPQLRDGWYPPIYEEDYDALKDTVKKYGYDSVEQLVRWRLYNDTGNGLMAELGSHQLDACSIFLGKVHPLAVTGVGGKYFYRKGKNDRQSDDHVFVTFEFPGKNHPKGVNKGTDKDDIVVVTYSSINTNGFEAYGETVMGTRGTLIVEAESTLMLYPERDPSKKQGDARGLTVTVTASGGDKPTLDASSTWGPPGARPPGTAAGPAAPGVVSRGYREEMEDFAYCVRLWDQAQGYEKDKEGKYVQRLPRCHGEVAMADAIIALTSNLAMKGRELPVIMDGKKVRVNRIEFEDKWFDAESKDVPDGDTTPKVPVE